MRLKLLTAILALTIIAPLSRGQLVTSIVPDGKVHKFEARDKQFWIDGQSTLLVSGEMHFGRTLPEDWDTRIKQAKAMGLNTISFYLFWNMCEPEEGKFDFTGMTDVRKMLQLCQENGMWVILRPGPYCCAEVEYGGIPWWTVKYPDVPIRSANPKWLEWSKRYINEVYKQVGDLQVTKGGPLLMVQMDNEFGMVSQGDNAYLVELQKIFTDVGFDVQLFTCDPGGPSGRGAIPGVLRGPNGYQGNRGRAGRGPARGGADPAPPAVEYPIFVPELYTNWFSGWGTPIATRYESVDSVTNWTTSLINEKASFNYYMFFGGTTYAFWNGCNEYLPVQTSYNYKAPIDEAGRITPKYTALRELLSSKLGITPPQPPADAAVIDIAAITLEKREALLDTLSPSPARVGAPVSMEDLNQAFGFINYRKSFPNGIKGTLELKNPTDYAIVLINGKTVGEAFRGYGPESNKIELPETAGPATLDILVYNLGRISVITASWSQNRARKGLIDGATLNGTDITDWQMYSLPVTSVTNPKASAKAHTGPTFYRGTFSLSKAGGSFLDMTNWGFGVVWVNGHNLGRYWDRGALRSLFVPSHWLKQGENEIVVLELHNAPKLAQVSGGSQIVATEAVPFAVRLDQATPRGGRRGGRGPAPAVGPATAPVGN